MRLLKRISLLSIGLFSAFSFADLRVSEWGTFTSLVGSNGVTQHGMYHEDEALPDFVHGFGEVLFAPIIPHLSQQRERCKFTKIPCEFLANNMITQKMETPVIYFYSPTRLEDVEIDVRFPEGAVSETFPAPVSTFPRVQDAPVLANGHTVFKVNVQDPIESMYSKRLLPIVDSQNIYSHARNVRSNVVEAGDEKEKFIFYRGVGRFQPNTSIASSGGNLTLTQPTDGGKIPAAFLVHVNDQGEGQLLLIGELNPGEIKLVNKNQIEALQTHPSLSFNVLSGPAMKSELVRGLQVAGLSDEEAMAMINTWENGYLKVPGLRLLYILPAQEVERTLPMKVTPVPDSLTRVFVGRIEVLTDVAETELLNRVLSQRDLLDVQSLGRFAEPMLRRTLEVYKDTAKNTSPQALLVFDRLIARAANLAN